MRRVLIVAGLAAAGYLWLRKREEVDDVVRRTAQGIRRQLDPATERVSKGLEHLAEAVMELNRRVQAASRAMDETLKRLAA